MAITANRIAEIRKSKGMTQQQLAEKLGAHWITVSKLERGKMALTLDWMERIAPILGVEVHDLVTRGDRPIGQARVIGHVLPDGIVEARVIGDVEYVDIVDIPQHLFSDLNTQWIIVEGDALAPTYHDGDFIMIKWIYEDYTKYIGRLCYFHITEVAGCLGYLYFGSKSSTWTIEVLSGPTLREQEVKGIAFVQGAIYADPAMDIADDA